MREPRFRAWIERYQKYMPVAMIHFEPILGKIDYIEVVATGGDWCKFYPEEYILEQYTGLEDKNGKEIYEGDIVREVIDASLEEIDGEYEYIVQWSDQFKEFVIQTTNKNKTFFHDELYQLNMSREVVGNIHETMNY